MDQKSAETIEVLAAFIQRQQAILAQARCDIARLQDLRVSLASDPASLLVAIHDLDLAGTDGDPIGISSLSDGILQLPRDIDWALFKGCDPAPFQSLSLQLRQSCLDHPSAPGPPRTPPSDLQLFVRNARRTLLDPVLSLFECMSEPSDDDDDEALDPAEIKREIERAKLRELKKRRIRYGGLGLLSTSQGLTDKDAQMGVYIRRDVEDESAEVDITMEDSGIGAAVGAPPPSIPETRLRKPTEKAKMQAQTPPRVRKKKSLESNNQEQVPPPSTSPAPPSTKPCNSSKPRSETYKQAWSVSEQCLLEKLLEDIPEGEKNRWQKISRAMSGRRTPRQVASRVQKYFEKLKKFGVAVDE